MAVAAMAFATFATWDFRSFREFEDGAADVVVAAGVAFAGFAGGT
jgi:hypothetical protein